MKYRCAPIEKGVIFLPSGYWNAGVKLTMFLGSQVMAKIISELVSNVSLKKKDIQN